MLTHPRYKIYQLYKLQDSLCTCCEQFMNIHDLETENIYHNDSGSYLLCYTCHEEKTKLLSDCSKIDSIIEMDLKPLVKFVNKTKMNEENFSSNPPIVVEPDLSYVNEAVEQENDETDPEERILTSWFHRAILYDEKREIYDDGQDTDFEAAQLQWEEENLSDNEEEDQNTQILGLDF